MQKAEFLSILAEGLKGASPEERAAAMQYYNEYIDEAGPEREEEVLAELGSPNKIAQDVIAASGAMATTGWAPPRKSASPEPIILPDTAPQHNQYKYQHPYEEVQKTGTGYNEKNTKIARIILIVMAAILLIPVLGGVTAAIGGIIVAIVCIFLVPLILGVALTASGVCLIVLSAIVTASSYASGILGIGIGVLVFALGGMCFHGTKGLLGKALPNAIRVCGKALGTLWKKLAKAFSSIFG